MNTNNTGQIYTLLVTKSEQEGYPLEGIVAYSIYKKEKIKFIEDYIKANPTATEKQIQKAKDTFYNILIFNIDNFNCSFRTLPRAFRKNGIKQLGK